MRVVKINNCAVCSNRYVTISGSRLTCRLDDRVDTSKGAEIPEGCPIAVNEPEGKERPRWLSRDIHEGDFDINPSECPHSKLAIALVKESDRLGLEVKCSLCGDVEVHHFHSHLYDIGYSNGLDKVKPTICNMVGVNE